MTLRRRPSKSSESVPAVLPLVQLWLLRILVPLGGHREFINQHCFSDDAVARMVGLGEWTDSGANEYDPRAARRALRELHLAAERKCGRAKAPTCLRANVARLSKLVGLSETECRILEFAVLIRNERLLDDTADFLGHLSSVKVCHALSGLLDLPESAVRAALRG